MSIPALQQQIERIKAEIQDLSDLRPGSLSQQFNVCGKKNCQCKASPPRKHGPYWQLGWTRHRKSTTRFIRQEHVPTVRRELLAYSRLQILLDEWCSLAARLSDLRLKSSRRP